MPESEVRLLLIADDPGMNEGVAHGPSEFPVKGILGHPRVSHAVVWTGAWSDAQWSSIVAGASEVYTKADTHTVVIFTQEAHHQAWVDAVLSFNLQLLEICPPGFASWQIRAETNQA